MTKWSWRSQRFAVLLFTLLPHRLIFQREKTQLIVHLRYKSGVTTGRILTIVFTWVSRIKIVIITL